MRKTRLCDELTKQVFTIGFTLRPEQESGYPRGGHELLQYLRAKNVDISVAITALLASCLRNGSNVHLHPSIVYIWGGYLIL